MDHADHVNLIRAGVEGGGLVWADFGAGWGAFTLALADVLGPGAEIHAVDRDANALAANARSMQQRFSEVTASFVRADFTTPLQLPPLDGIVMANSLHFQKDQPAVVERALGYLRPGGRLVLVEYNIERGNQYVPHPVSFERWKKLASEAGFASTELLARRPSRFLSEIYSAVSRL
ncbi:MAG: class I SAM-dependent methyltransferase [bacterium]